MKKITLILAISFSLIGLIACEELSQEEKYSLTVNDVVGAYVTISPDRDNYSAGTTVYLEVTTDYDHEFCSWSGDASGYSTMTSVYMNSDKEISVNIIRNGECHLKDRSNGNCSVVSNMEQYDETHFCSGLKLVSQEEFEKIPIAKKPEIKRLRSIVDNSDYLPPPLSQGQQGSCTAWATAYAMKTYQEKKEEHWDLTMLKCDHKCYVRSDHVFSPAFVYNQLNGGQDDGITFIAAFGLLKNKGCCVWGDMPYDQGNYLSQPTSSALNNALKYKIHSYSRINSVYYVFTQTDINTIKSYLNQGFVIPVSVVTYEGFQDKNSTYYYKETGEYVWCTTDGQGSVSSCHAMVITGYDDRYGFKVLNSWGSNWGNEGYIWIKFKFFRDTIGVGAYVVHDASNM